MEQSKSNQSLFVLAMVSAQIFDAMMPGKLPPYVQSSPPALPEEHPDPAMPLTFGQLQTRRLVNGKPL